MTTTPSRPVLRRAAATLLLPLVLTACGGEASEPSAAPASAVPAPSAVVTATAPVSPPAPPSPAAPSPAAPADDAEVVSLTVAAGKVAGDTGRVPVALGDKVRVTVTADVADEIHVHGYDLHQDTVPGQAVMLEFVADQPGVFEVELEESRVLLTRLQVQ